MSSIQEAQTACIFCYRIIDSSEFNDSSGNIKKFVDFLTRLDDGTSKKLLFERVFSKITSISKILECCTNCCVIIEEFCDIYHQIKCLELKLNWKLDTLGRKIELANRIPKRWVNFNSTLGRTFEDDIGKIEESQDVIAILRSTIVKSGNI